MGKLPAIQFYPGDWHKDTGVQALDYETRGVWFELLLLMWESERRGYLVLNGIGMADEILAKILGIHGNKWKKIKRKLEVTGVMSTEENTGISFNRRMVRDEEARQKAIENGKLGGNPALLPQSEGVNPSVNGTDNPRVKRKTTPSSSSSITASAICLPEVHPSPLAPKHLTRYKTELIGMMPHVWLTDGHYKRLCDTLGIPNTELLMKRLEEYSSKKKKWAEHSDHYRTLLSWDRMAKERGQQFFIHPKRGAGYYYERDIEASGGGGDYSGRPLSERPPTTG